ncbi:MAG: hypothetical protein SFW36_13815 [Leptolyngbyaceae cyanobacterium bins.59]|nr:hypothetical protein [Leptolyngbyaceae cyanobacterium bins.59]
MTVPNVSPNDLKQAALTHRDNLLQNLARRIQVAHAEGNVDLVRLLEKEQHQLLNAPDEWLTDGIWGELQTLEEMVERYFSGEPEHF